MPNPPKLRSKPKQTSASQDDLMIIKVLTKISFAFLSRHFEGSAALRFRFYFSSRFCAFVLGAYIVMLGSQERESESEGGRACGKSEYRIGHTISIERKSECSKGEMGKFCFGGNARESWIALVWVIVRSKWSYSSIETERCIQTYAYHVQVLAFCLYHKWL